MTQKNTLICKKVYFYSMKDEDIFFEWIKRIECITDFNAAKDELYLDLVDRRLSYNDVKDLIAFFYRYEIDMQQLAVLFNEDNKDAFKPWQKEIFKKKKKS